MNEKKGEIMRCLINIPEVNGVLSLSEVPDASLGLDVVEGGWVEVPENIANWPPGTPRPNRILAICKSDPCHYRLFKYESEIEPAGFQASGLTHYGPYPPTRWNHFVQVRKDRKISGPLTRDELKSLQS